MGTPSSPPSLSPTLRDPDPDRLLLSYQDSFPVPTWAPDTGICSGCKDALIPGYRHHCRLCGYKFCSQCTGLFYVQKRFQRKKDGEGPSRVCWWCRDRCLAKKEEQVDKIQNSAEEQQKAMRGKVQKAKTEPLMELSHSSSSNRYEDKNSEEIISWNDSDFNQDTTNTAALKKVIAERAIGLAYVTAAHDYDGKVMGTLRFSKGQKMKVIRKGVSWWLAVLVAENSELGHINIPNIGWIPPNFVLEDDELIFEY